jgi:predicted transcriptional regulator
MADLFTEKTSKRDYIQILADIVKASRETSNMTKIMRYANVQYYTWVTCIEKLCEKEFLEVIPNDDRRNNSSRTQYKATSKGLAWTKRVETIYDEIDHR